LGTIRIAENLELGSDNRVRCSRCGHEFCTSSENWKTRALRSKSSMVRKSLIELHQDLGIFEYICPGCGVLLDVEIARNGEDPLWDVRLGYTPR